MAILVTGGAGYIGSVVVEELCALGESVVVLDNLIRGHRDAVAPEAIFYNGDIGNSDLVREIVLKHGITAAMHFSAFAYVGESVSDPKLYFENNVGQTIQLLSALIGCDVKNFVFSSTCAVYGEPQYTPIDEGHPRQPTSPYGWSKLWVEHILNAYDSAYGLKFIALRYFNAAGATVLRGEHHDPETHLIPLALAAAAGDIDEVSIFGNDYPTPDGTAIRDYVHVSDLASAHILALCRLESGGSSDFINLGTGRGYSVMEILESAERVTGRTINRKIAPARAGDPSYLAADAGRAAEVLGWQPKFSELDTIIKSAWDWRRANPGGYND